MSSAISRKLAGTSVNFGNKFLIVGDGGDFKTVQNAIDYISDASAANPYYIKVLPGSYSGFSFNGKTGITVSGCGDSTIITCTNNISNQVQVHSTDCTLSNMKLTYTDDGGFASIQACLRRAAAVTRFTARNLKFAIGCSASATSQRYAMYVEYSNAHNRYENIEIVTNCSGIYVPTGNNDYYNCNVWLTGNDAALPRYGVYKNDAGRAYFHGGRFTTGYGETNPNTSQNIYCFYQPATLTDTGSRMHLFGVEAFAANTSTTPGNLASIRAENGWIRVFGGMFQAEDQNSSSPYSAKAIISYLGTVNEPASGSKGKIEIYGARYTGVSGNIFGGSAVATAFLDSTDDGISLSKFEGRYFICDTSTAFGVTVAGGAIGAYNENNSVQTFVNTGANSLTITAGGSSGTIDGAATYTLTTGNRISLIKVGEQTWFTL